MKIGILTHPLTFNYGGILQCFALTTYLQKLGHDVVVIRRESNDTWLKREIRIILKAFHIRPYYNPSKEDIGINTREFVDSKLRRTAPIYSNIQMDGICKKYSLDAVIVGSDQVWRADFALHYGYNYFLDFVPEGVKKVAYAASFGLSEWYYTEEQTKMIKGLLKKFNGISVREKEAVGLCKDNLGVKAEHMLDPTLLLNAKDYDVIVSPKLIEGLYVFIYWLGEKNLIKEDIEAIEAQGKKVVFVTLRTNESLPRVEDWLSYIKYCDYVITDSFHGCVFSSVFHKKVDVRYHKSYGRIRSLLDIMNINEEIFKNMDDSSYLEVENILNKYRNNASIFINNALNNNGTTI